MTMIEIFLGVAAGALIVFALPTLLVLLGMLAMGMIAMGVFILDWVQSLWKN